MQTQARTEEPRETVEKLIRSEYDLIGAYQAAIDRVELEGNPLALRNFLTDHERHVRELSVAVLDMGFEPPAAGDYQGLLTKGKVLVSGVFGDRAVLKAMKSTEERLNEQYDLAATRTDLSPALHDIILRHLSDVQRHWAWYDERIDQISE